MSNKITKCRVCGNANLIKVVDLGVQYLTGIFPHVVTEQISRGPLELLKCHPFNAEDVCSLLQLSQSYDLKEMYGDNYGYRSGLNPSMVKHLKNKIERIVSNIEFVEGDIVVDIGSNDGTTLGFYPATLRRVGVDPTGEKFRAHYQKGVELISDFFSGEILLAYTSSKKAKVVTSFSMFYDLESPVDFCKQIRDVLDPKGIWVFEQSYMPLMLERNSFDTICHEHLEYYGLEQIIWIMAEAGLKVVDVELNDINGGSFSVTATLKSNPHPVSLDVSAMLKKEIDLKTSSLEPYEKFNAGIDRAKVELHDFLHTCEKQGHKVAALGASTKGNVLLQHLKLSSKEIVAVGEINVDKFGRITPGTNIPIVDEAELLSTDIEYFIVLPWHFRDYFVECGRYKGKKLVFPLPRLEIVQL